MREEKPGTPPMRALQWIRDNCLSAGGIRVESGHPSAYPEVTGYTVPTLLKYGEPELAAKLVRWLIGIQRADGSYTNASGGQKYIFDTGQVLRGLLAGTDLVPQARDAARRTADYLLARMVRGGNGGFPSQYENTICPDCVYLYVLPPLIEAAEVFETRGYRDAAHCCVDFYTRHSDFLDLGTLTHFLAYQLEALIDMGRAELARPVLEQLQKLQKPDGAVRGMEAARWACIPGLAQLAICWYKLGEWKPADLAVGWLERQQRRNGGFRGSCGIGADYKQDVEISWAAKFYLDAHLLRVDAFFNRHADMFPDDVSPNDGRARAIVSCVGNGDKVLEVGCGKGRFLKVVKDARPNVECTGVDPACELSSCLPPDIHSVPGALESIPLPDESFDVVFSVEAIEHSANPERAVAEMARVAKAGGWILIIDKQRAHWGRLKCPPWEWWPDIEQLKTLLNRWCDDVSAQPVSYQDSRPADGLIVAWRGRKRSRMPGAQWSKVLLSTDQQTQVLDALRSNRLSDWAKAVILETEPGQDVLEVGSGTGQISLQLAQAGRSVTCLDVSQESLDFTQRCAEQTNLDITTVCADATRRLPFDDGRFDCVWSSGLLEHFDTRQRQSMLREWARVCRGKMIHLVPNAACFAYRLGKQLQESRGDWPYGLEMPLRSLREDYEAAGIDVTAEFSVAPEHALKFLPAAVQSLRKNLAGLMTAVSPQDLQTWNQGYLLVTVGSKKQAC